MWAQLDNYEDYTDAFDMEQAMVLREQEHTERVVDALLPSRGFSILSAKPKVGKSTLARNLIASVLNGGSFLGRDIKRPGPVVYYVLEESFSEIVDDLLALGVRRHSPIRFRRGTFQPVTFRHRLQEDIVNFKPSLIVADPLIKILGLQDVNDYGIVNAAITPLVDIMRRTDAHFLACHHSNKSSPSLDMDSMLGSTAFVGAVDAALLMHRDQNNNARYIRTYRRYRVDREIPKTQILMDEDTAQVSLKSADSHTSTQDKLEDQAWKITEFAVISGGAKSSNALSGDYKGDRNANLAAIKFAIQKGWLIRTDDKAIRIGPNWSTTQTDIAGM
jgi:RecA-family ATPase